MRPPKSGQPWTKRSGAHAPDVASAVPIIRLGPVAGAKLVKEIAQAVRTSPNRDVLGGEEFRPLIEADAQAPYSTWLMRFGEEGKRPSQQEWHRHVIPGKKNLPDHVSHRLLLVACSGGEAGIERFKVDAKGKPTGSLTHYTLQPDTLYAFRFDGDDVHRFTSDNKQVMLAAISFHPLDKVHGKEGMNSQTVMYEGKIPEQTEYKKLPGVKHKTRVLSEFDDMVRQSVIMNWRGRKPLSPDAIAEYMEYLSSTSGQQMAKWQAACLITDHERMKELY